MKHSLQLRLSQHLTLTPQLQQSIRLLQLSTQELDQEIERYLRDNPLLERADGAEGAADVATGATRLSDASQDEAVPSTSAEETQATSDGDAEGERSDSEMLGELN
ncbi:MAG TPA: RNA polymerase factor sigma-54, partial [Burkholderiales bacterium]|nr:RNA polymerase factor sigma-54 [Burkholderiales bacterium]